MRVLGRSRRWRAALLAATASASLAVAPGAPAEHTCDTPVIVMGYTVVAGHIVGGVNPNGFRCIVSESHDHDGRVIEPGANAIRIRLNEDLGVAIRTLQATVEVFTVAQPPVQLTRTLTTLGSYSYDSALIPIDPATAGCINVTVHRPDSTTASGTYRTLNATCDAAPA